MISRGDHVLCWHSTDRVFDETVLTPSQTFGPTYGPVLTKRLTHMVFRMQSNTCTDQKIPKSHSDICLDISTVVGTDTCTVKQSQSLLWQVVRSQMSLCLRGTAVHHPQVTVS